MTKREWQLFTSLEAKAALAQLEVAAAHITYGLPGPRVALLALPRRHARATGYIARAHSGI